MPSPHWVPLSSIRTGKSLLPTSLQWFPSPGASSYLTTAPPFIPLPPSQGICQLQFKETLTCMSTSCLIILPSAHLSTARASPGTMTVRSYKKSREHFPSSPRKDPSFPQEANRGPSQDTFQVFLLLPHLFPSHSCPENDMTSKNITPCPKRPLTHQQPHVETVTLHQEL